MHEVTGRPAEVGDKIHWHVSNDTVYEFEVGSHNNLTLRVRECDGPYIERSQEEVFEDLVEEEYAGKLDSIEIAAAQGIISAETATEMKKLIYDEVMEIMEERFGKPFDIEAYALSITNYGRHHP